MMGQAPNFASRAQRAVTRHASPPSPGVLSLGATGAGTAMASISALGVLNIERMTGGIWSVAAIVTAGLICLWLANVFTHLSAKVPTSASLLAYAVRGMGVWAGLFFVFPYFMAMVLLGGVEALIVGKLANEVMPVPVLACAASFLIGTWAICRSGIQVGYRAQIIATGLLFSLTIVLCAVQVFKTAQSGFLAERLLLTFPGGLAMAAAVGQAMFLFMGFELITSHAEIARNGSIKRSLRRAIPFLTVFYVALAVGISTLSTSPSLDEYLFVPQLALANATGESLAVAPVMLIFVLASFSSYNGALLGLSRFVYALARQGTLPRSLSVLDPKTLTARPALNALLFVSLFLMGLVYLSSFYLPVILAASVIAAIVYALMAVLRERAPFLEKGRTTSSRLLGAFIAMALLAIASGVVISAGDYQVFVLFILAALFIFAAYLACGAGSRKRSDFFREGAGCVTRLLPRSTLSR